MKIKETKHLFLITIFLLIVVFTMGIFVGKWVSSSDVDEITAFIKNNELNTESYLIEQQFIEDFEHENCELANERIASLSKELWEIGRSLSPEDAQQKLGEENYNFMKRRYHLMQIRTYILFYKLKQQCETADSVVLFYFSRDDNSSKEQGHILDRLVEDYGIRVFTIEYDYSDELAFLEEYYQITETPTLIIDYEIQLPGMISYEIIEALITKERLLQEKE